MIKILLELNKVKIVSAVTLSTLLGYVMAHGSFSTDALLPVLGIFILAGGSAMLNQYQEIEIDRIMERTKNRPLPTGKISKNLVLAILLAEIITGAFLLYISSGFLAMQLGLLALLWYNGIYTNLKKKTAFAVIPGAFIGAIPPAVGWVAGGGLLSDQVIIVIGFFFFMWQIPHFWLLALMHGEEYTKAGLPSVSKIYNTEQLKKITFIWTLATAISAMFIPMFGLVEGLSQKIIITALNIALIVLFMKLYTNSNPEFKVKKYFITINIFLLFIMTAIFADNLIY